MRIFPLGDSAITVELGDEISLALNERSIALAESFITDPFPGMIESVPAYSSATLFYNPTTVRKEFPAYPNAFAAVKAIVENALNTLNTTPVGEKRSVDVPITISDDASPDLENLSEFSGLSRVDVVEIFLSRTYRVYMLGFLPGFPYMGDVDERIAAPRLKTPRTKVPNGSIGIAGKQTGIYPLESPGGWNIIGRTVLKMFDPDADEPCLLRPGDEIRFVRC